MLVRRKSAENFKGPGIVGLFFISKAGFFLTLTLPSGGEEFKAVPLHRIHTPEVFLFKIHGGQ